MHSYYVKQHRNSFSAINGLLLTIVKGLMDITLYVDLLYNFEHIEPYHSTYIWICHFKVLQVIIRITYILI